MKRRLLSAFGTVAFSALVSGCAITSDLTGAAAGFAAGTATANPAVGIAVGVTVKAATREGMNYVAREQHQAEQNAIAAAAAKLRVGQTQHWAVDHRLARDAHGEVRVLRTFRTPLAACKELAFSVAADEPENAAPAWFTTTACREGRQWKWASAEPAVERWGNLQ
jgi:hypothetical protein